MDKKGRRRMIISLDIETYEYVNGIWTPSWDPNHFCLAVIKSESWKGHKTFYCKEELWEYVIKLGKAEAKRGKVLNVYSHNTNFDSARYFDYTDNHLNFFSEFPFIAAYKLYKEEGEKLGIKIPGKYKEIIKFLDTYSIYRLPLKKVAKVLGMEKMEMPENTLEQYKGDSIKQLKLIEKYCERDTDITLKAILHIKEKLEKEGIKIKRLYTISQIAIQYLTTELKKLNHKGTLYDEEKGYYHWAKYTREVHQAYRGGRVEAFKTGVFNNIHGIDVNSLYPYITTQMRYPDLSTEEKIKEPLKHVNKEELFKNIGIAKARIKNNTCPIGILPVRTPTGSYYPRIGQEAIGVWTLEELKEAHKQKYDIIDIEWVIKWDETTNPFKIITPKIYKLRKQGDEFDDFFYKMMMNASYGKLAQTKGGREYVIDDVEKVKEYIEKSYEVIKGIDLNYVYEKPTENIRKKYYAPILPTLINALGRIHMYKLFKQIGSKNLIYTDTDSCYYEGKWINTKISKEIGDYSIEATNEEAVIWGRKSKRIGENISLSGVSKKDITKENFDKGYIEHTQMIGLRSAKDKKEIGQFIKKERNLKDQQNNYKDQNYLLREQHIVIDEDIGEINYFLYKM